MNEALTLGRIPPEVYDYKLGNRSALDRVIDQYQASTDKCSGIVTDPNRTDDPEYRAAGATRDHGKPEDAAVGCRPTAVG